MKRSRGVQDGTGVEARVDESGGLGKPAGSRSARTYVRDVGASNTANQNDTGSCVNSHALKQKEVKLSGSVARNLRETSKNIEKNITTFNLWERNDPRLKNTVGAECLDLERRRKEYVKTAQVELSNACVILNEKYVKNRNMPPRALSSARMHCYITLYKLREMFLLRNLTLEGRIALLKAMNSISNAICDIRDLEERNVGYPAISVNSHSPYADQAQRAADLLLYSLKCSPQVVNSEYGVLLTSSICSCMPLTKLLGRNISDKEKGNIAFFGPFGFRCTISAIENGMVPGFSAPSSTFDIRETQGQPHSVVALLAARFFINTYTAYGNMCAVAPLALSDIAITQMYLSECTMFTIRALRFCKTEKLDFLKNPLNKIKNTLADALAACTHCMDDTTRACVTEKLQLLCRLLAADCFHDSHTGDGPYETDKLLEKMAVAIERCLDRLDKTRKLFDHNWTRPSIALPLLKGEIPPSRSILQSSELTSLNALKNRFCPEGPLDLSHHKKKNYSPSLLKKIFSRAAQRYSPSDTERKRKLSEQSEALSLHVNTKKPAVTFGPLPPVPEIKPQHQESTSGTSGNKKLEIKGILRHNHLPTAAYANAARDPRSQSLNDMHGSAGVIPDSNLEVYMDMSGNKGSPSKKSIQRSTTTASTGSAKSGHYCNVHTQQSNITLSDTVCYRRPKNTPALENTNAIYVNCVRDFHKSSELASPSAKRFAMPRSIKPKVKESPQYENLSTASASSTETTITSASLSTAPSTIPQIHNVRITPTPNIYENSSVFSLTTESDTATHTTATISTATIECQETLITTDKNSSPDTAKTTSASVENEHGSCNIASSSPVATLSQVESSNSKNMPECIEILQKVANSTISTRRQRSISETLSVITQPTVATIKSGITRGRSKSLEAISHMHNNSEETSYKIASHQHDIQKSDRKLKQTNHTSAMMNSKCSSPKIVTDTPATVETMKNSLIRGRLKSIDAISSNSSASRSQTTNLNIACNNAVYDLSKPWQSIGNNFHPVSERPHTSPISATASVADAASFLNSGAKTNVQTSVNNHKITQGKPLLEQHRVPAGIQDIFDRQATIPLSTYQYFPVSLTYPDDVTIRPQDAVTDAPVNFSTKSEYRTPASRPLHGTMGQIRGATLSGEMATYTTEDSEIPTNIYASINYLDSATATGRQLSSVATPYAVTTIIGENTGTWPTNNALHKLRFHDAASGVSVSSTNAEYSYSSQANDTPASPRQAPMATTYINNNAPCSFGAVGTIPVSLNGAPLYSFETNSGSAMHMLTDSSQLPFYVGNNTQYTPYLVYTGTPESSQSTATFDTRQPDIAAGMAGILRDPYQHGEFSFIGNTQYLSPYVSNSFTPNQLNNSATNFSRTERNITTPALPNYQAVHRDNSAIPRYVDNRAVSVDQQYDVPPNSLLTNMRTATPLPMTNPFSSYRNAQQSSCRAWHDSAKGYSHALPVLREIREELANIQQNSRDDSPYYDVPRSILESRYAEPKMRVMALSKTATINSYNSYPIKSPGYATQNAVVRNLKVEAASAGAVASFNSCEYKTNNTTICERKSRQKTRMNEILASHPEHFLDHNVDAVTSSNDAIYQGISNSLNCLKISPTQHKKWNSPKF